MTTAEIEQPRLAAWPLSSLQLASDHLLLVPVGDAHLDRLVELAREGIHDDTLQPFANGWTDRTGDDFEQNFAQYFWRQRATWSPQSWALAFAVLEGGDVVGVQQLEAKNFPVLRTISTGSWIGRAHQGRGLGTEMRAVVLEFAFEHLGADVAVSGAYDYNHASIRVTEKLGYRPNGVRRDVVRGQRADALLFRLERRQWATSRQTDVRVAGLDGCRSLFGL